MSAGGPRYCRLTTPDIMASLLGRSVAARSPWTPEECGRYAAARDIAVLAALADDRRLLAFARRLRLIGGGMLSSTSSASNLRNTPSAASTAAAGASTVERDSTACRKGAQAAEKPSSSRVVSGPAAVQPRTKQLQAQRVVRQPRRRSEEAVRRRSEAFEQRRIRSKLFQVLPVVGRWARQMATASADASISAAHGRAVHACASAAPALDGAQRSTQRGGSCESSGGPARPPPPVAAVYAPAPYVRQWTDARGVVRQQMYGRCGECLAACVLDHREEGGRGWLCSDCFWAEPQFDLFD
jgi:hypothetical protein